MDFTEDDLEKKICLLVSMDSSYNYHDWRYRLVEIHLNDVREEEELVQQQTTTSGLLHHHQQRQQQHRENN